ncbi:MAG TPA: hypothetical protein VNG13_00630 [Mycobacteriales bacterium]|nr:hypothetical protein [Mycobacteriales bacterium]
MTTIDVVALDRPDVGGFIRPASGPGATPGPRTANRPAPGPIDELAVILAQLRQRLDVLTTPRLDTDAAERSLGGWLDELDSYLVEDLIPLLCGLAVRVRPALRQPGAAWPGRQIADEHARLLRLTERVAVLRAQHALAGDTAQSRDQTAALVDELSRLAGAHLTRAQHTLPAALRNLAPVEAARIIKATRRTAQAARDHLPLDLQPVP